MIFLFLQLINSKYVNDRIISGSIVANWTETPLISETLAFLEDVDHSAFWDMVDTLSTIKQIPSTINSILSFSKNYVDDDLLSLLNFSLQIRYYSPRIEYFRSLAPVKDDYFILCRNSVVDITQESVKSCSTHFQPYEAISGNGNSTVALYVNVEKGGWGSALQALQKIEKYVKFVVRPIGFSDTPIKMSGYGVQLRPFKYSMEFNVSDETKLIKSNKKISKEEKKDFSVFGLNIDDSDKTEKVSKIDQLPFQFAAFAKNSSDPVNTIREITTNFPLFANKICETKVSDSKIKNFQRSPQFSSPGKSDLFINGRKLLSNDLNYYSIYQALIEEYRTNKILRDTFKIDEDSLRDFQKSGNTVNAAQIPTVDARSKLFLHWINNLEADEKYLNKYPKSLFVFANENDNFPGIARNVANAIFVIDPSNQDDLDTLNYIEDLIDQQFPVRFGYIVAPMKRSPVSKKIYYAYVHILLKYGAKAAHKLLSKVNDMRGVVDDKTGKLGPVKQIFWDKAFGSIAIDRRSPSFKTINDLFKPKSDESRFIQRLSDFVNKVGVSVPSMILNGKFVEENHPERYLHSMLNEETMNIRDLIVRRMISDTTEDFHEVILSQCGAYKRYNKLIQAKKKDFSETIPIQAENIQNQRAFVKWMQSIQYKYGTTSGIKMQSFWVIKNCQDNSNVEREVERFMSEIAKTEETRLAYIENVDEIPEMVQNIIGIPSGKVTAVFNGRVVHLDPEAFSRFDLQLIQEWEKPYSTQIAKNIQERSIKRRTLNIPRPIRELSDSLLYISMIASSLSHQGSSRTGQPFKTFKNRAVNLFRSPKNSSTLNVHLLIDPFSVEGQRLSCILPILKSFSFGVLLNPPLQTDKLELESLSSFYSIADSNENNNDNVYNDSFNFSFFNQSTVYSIVPDIPDTWHIYRKSAEFDLDNINVGQLQSGVHNCQFQLNSILVEGCVNGRETDGLELKLLTLSGKQRDETRCINRNGYFQLQSLPGSYMISTNSEENFKVYSDSYFPKFNFLQTTKNIVSLSSANGNKTEKIHIFIVASGHLYERLERIMMLSAVKSTKRTVKFWILENFVSPQHRQILPQISAKYKFEYEFTSYKWPRWMVKETQQQRVFWGYKILFLDLMFPNDLKRVIYVDADDVIRADFFELMELDMKGAPYAFTPFCEDRPEMEEYRFWNDGYWRNILNGLRYHISAMFVVDLATFRRKNIGDLIRKAYEDLCSDTISLSNLDQDLPNLLQTRGAEIFSLPQEWLWCGSWCSDNTMKNAKTIDLCNNPRTKQSKLEYAKNTIAEWKVLDKEINSEFVSDEL